MKGVLICGYIYRITRNIKKARIEETKEQYFNKFPQKIQKTTQKVEYWVFIKIFNYKL